MHLAYISILVALLIHQAYPDGFYKHNGECHTCCFFKLYEDMEGSGTGTTKSYTDRATCHTECLSDNNCQYFDWNDGSTQCVFYETTGITSQSGVEHYEMMCTCDTVSCPTTVQPTTVQPTTVQPTTVQPTTVQPTTVQPTTVQPTTVQPTTVQPTTVQPTTVQPTTVQPTTVQPTTVQPTTVQPTTVQQTTVQQTTVQPTTVQPTTVPDQTTLQPTTVQPTTVELTTVPETTVGLTTVPETTVGLTTVPETTIGLTTVPETTIGLTTVPETTVGPTTLAKCGLYPGGIDVPGGWSSCAGCKSTHVLHGSVTYTVQSTADCLTDCETDSTCFAIDYDVATGTCYIHTSLTACSATEGDSDFHHVIRNTAPCCENCCKVECEEMPPDDGSSNPGIALANLNGWSTCPGKKITGGTLSGTMLAGACFDACKNDATCEAVDYDVSTQECYHHTSATGCNAMTDASTVQHMKRPTSTCHSACCHEACADMTASPYSPNYGGFILDDLNGWSTCPEMQIMGGCDKGGGMTAQDCYDLCANDPDCIAVDYNVDFGQCYTHDSTTACGTLLSAVEVHHIKRPTSDCWDECCVHTTTSLPVCGAIVPSIYNNFNPGVLNVPSGWTICNTFNIIGGCFKGLMTGDACAQLCESDSLCLGFDYNVDFSYCYTHDASTICSGTLDTSSPEVQHFQKPSAAVTCFNSFPGMTCCVEP